MTMTIKNTAANTQIVFSPRGQMTFKLESGAWVQSDFLHYGFAMSDADIESTVNVFVGSGWAVVNINGQDVK